MKYLPILVCALYLISCDQTSKTAQSSVITPGIDMEAEMASIEETRNGFMQAIKEKRYGDLRLFATADIISLTPICGPWEEYKSLRASQEGLFSYDSLIMKPKETVIVSDSVAYDFGTSSVYYTNAEGAPIEIKDTYLAIIKKDKNDGVWRLHREIATTNLLDQ
jgi:ketosteroid isomerase-like protein